MTTDHRKLRQLRHAVQQAVEMLESPPAPAKAAWAMVVRARDTLRLALEATAPEPDPGDTIDAEELRPGRSER